MLALTPTRLVVGHTDDQPAEAPATGTYAASSTESVPLSKINSVVLTRVVTQPERYRAGSDDVGETWLTVGWDGVRRVDLEPAGCEDPQCEADHGYTGVSAVQDVSLRISAEADGVEAVEGAREFARSLRRSAVERVGR